MHRREARGRRRLGAAVAFAVVLWGSGAGGQEPPVLSGAEIGPPPIAAVSYEQVGEPVSIDGILARAAVHSGPLRRANIELEVADVNVEAERATLAPLLQLGVSRAHRDEPTSSILEEGLRITDTYGFNASVSKRLRWGTDISLSYDANHFKSVQPFTLAGFGGRTITTGPFWNETLAFNLRQPLLRGFGSDLNLVGVHTAEVARDAAELRRRQLGSETVLAVLTAYFELYYADRDVAIKVEQIEIGLQQREATEAMVRSGRVAPVEMDVIDQRLILLHEAYIVAVSQRRAKALDLQAVAGGDGTVVPSSSPDLTIPQLDDRVVEEAVTRSAEVASLTEQQRAMKVALVAREDAVKPQLDFNMSVGQQGLSDAYVESLEQVSTLKAGNVFVGLTLAMPLDNERAERLLEADRLRIQQLDVDIEMARTQVASEALKARDLVRLNLERVELAERSVVYARKTLDAERAKFRSGRSTNQSVLEFQDQLGQAEVRLVRSRADVALSVLNLLHVQGALLEHFNLRLDGPGAR